MNVIFSAEVSTRIVAELEAVPPLGQAMVCNGRHEHPCNAGPIGPYSGCNVLLLWMAHRPAIARLAF